MNCKQARRQISALSQPADAAPALTRHVLECDSCRGLLEERKVLHAAIVLLRAETASLGPRDCVEERVLAELNLPTALRYRRTVKTRWWAAAITTVMAAICFTFFVVHRTTKTVPAISTVVSLDEPFTAVPFVVPPALYERTTVVRSEVPLQIMLSAGFEIHGGEPGSGVLADVLYGEDGRILAVRLVPQPNSFSDERTD